MSGISRSSRRAVSVAGATPRTEIQRENDRAISVREFGAKGDGVTDDSAAIQAALTNLPAYHGLYFPRGQYLCDGLTRTLPLRVFSDAALPWNTFADQDTKGAVLKKKNNGGTMLAFNGAGQPGGYIDGVSLLDIGVSGGGNTGDLVSMNLVVAPRVNRVGFRRVFGRALALSAVFEGRVIDNSFNECGASGSAVIDMLPASDWPVASKNVNNLNIISNTFGSIAGNAIRAQAQSNAAFVRILENKFEWDATWQANAAVTAVISLSDASMWFIEGNNFTNYTTANGNYGRLIEILTGGKGYPVEISQNMYNTPFTPLVVNNGDVRVVGSKNEAISFSTVPNETEFVPFVNTSTYQQRMEPVRITNGSRNSWHTFSGAETSYAKPGFLSGFVTAHDAPARIANGFVPDQNTMSSAQTVLRLPAGSTGEAFRIRMDHLQGWADATVPIYARFKCLSGTANLVMNVNNGAQTTVATPSVAAGNWTWVKFSVPAALLNADCIAFCQYTGNAGDVLFDGFVVGEGDSTITSTWNGANPLKIGSNFLWVDGSGRLRIKASAPSADTDGTIVGAQS